MSLLSACAAHPNRDNQATDMKTTHVDVPTDYHLFTALPSTADVWVYQQQARDLYLLSGVGFAASPDDVVVVSEPVEFHVGNRFFFEEGLGVTGESLERELSAIQGADRVPPFVLTTGVQRVEGRTEIAVPSDFDGWMIFLKPIGSKTMFAQRVEVKMVRAKN
jgi:hypothetical protein